MATASLPPIDLSPEPDLHPIYPSSSSITPLLSSESGLSPVQKKELIAHCLSRACLFADLSLLSFLLTDTHAQGFVDLGARDEDGLGVVSLTILGFGSESEREVEREECVRLLISEGADANMPDEAGWTALHHAALLSPPSLISHLLTHGCSPFSVTKKNLTPLDIVSAYATVPGREVVSLLLGEAMRSAGWTGGRMEERRKVLEMKLIRKSKQRSVRDNVEKRLEISRKWWGDDEWETWSSDSSEDEDENDEDDSLYTPPSDYTTMLVFSPPYLSDIFQSLITNFQPSLRNSEPASALYMLARFACLNCDHNWLEDLIIGATDAIEDNIFNRPEDLTCLIFWLYNTTVWLHLMRCDNSINETCELLGSFVLIEEVINSVFVFMIRYIERRIDTLIDSAILDHSPLPEEFDGIQFEGEWSFLRSFGAGKKKTNATSASTLPPRNGNPPVPSSAANRLPSPPTTPGAGTKGFSSLRQTFTRSRAVSTTAPMQGMFPEQPSTPQPSEITGFFDALQTMLTLSGINPALITQMWSQILYWMSCEIFNRVLTRKKHLCRSRAVQINMNLGVLEEWIEISNLPRGVISHLAPVRDLLNWLQCLSSITEFANLVATIQTMKHLNPLQMRRAVREYKYEVNEGRMTEECSQYLAQLQKDWERHRVKIGVEALRREMGERERERAEEVVFNDAGSLGPAASISSNSTEASMVQRNIDLLFDRDQDATPWEPAKPPDVLGEFLDSRYMLPLVLPSDPRMLSALPRKPTMMPTENGKGDKVDHRTSVQLMVEATTRSASRSSRRSRSSIPWLTQTKRLREVSVDALQWVDGIVSASRWTRPLQTEPEEDEDADGEEEEGEGSDLDGEHTGRMGHGRDETVTSETKWVTTLTSKPSLRNKGRSASKDPSMQKA
ncbi:uncharacterized protein STEHIDRAFT_151915 [Stereum hirsutum FP-91666 SS1]|uniref:uncharacterized protein n=1 Tax=Stereum hirsutum (strain FP-91666) TaxID=721885 RepID=UPI000440F077|nr:uncharacterized protein STEHIDRAFT_151915 [Stereum hirsutum FP-91666 SS1]EIM92597.1 hypothetical protein STEHIDRAFT_151915 [Stereum hirsutum FP-91666 SS1]